MLHLLDELPNPNDFEETRAKDGYFRELRAARKRILSQLWFWRAVVVRARPSGQDWQIAGNMTPEEVAWWCLSAQVNG